MSKPADREKTDDPRSSSPAAAAWVPCRFAWCRPGRNAVEPDLLAGLLGRDIGLVGRAVLCSEVELGLHRDKLVGNDREAGRVDDDRAIHPVRDVQGPSASCCRDRATPPSGSRRTGVKYSTVQNWYLGDAEGNGGVYDFVTKRSMAAGRSSKISWTQVETGSAITWKYPGVVLKGGNSVGEFYSVALTARHQQADTGSKMVHLD
jgi:hypothetical protein